MSNFLNKSKDLYAGENGLEWFGDVFRLIKDLSVAKNYYNTDLFNIEEIISILEMQSFLGGEELNVIFSDYIKETIRRYTPVISPPESTPSNWYQIFFNNRRNNFLPFFMHILRAEFASPRSGLVRRTVNDGTRYAIISLNYDLVVESFVDAINASRFEGDLIEVEKKVYDPTWSKLNLAKLHGTIEEGPIVPPTWAKGTHRSIVPVWSMASEILRDSNHIRFIGYSLPVADSYLKYLLKSSVLLSERLKTVDVICTDYDGSVKQRYEDFFRLPSFRFANCSLMDLQAAFAKKFTVDGFVSTEYASVSSLNSEAVYDSFMMAHGR